MGELLFCIGVPACAVFAYLIYVFSIGWGAFGMSRQASGEYALTLKFVGLNLCEPLVNTTLFLLIFWFLPRRYGTFDTNFSSFFFSLSPMFMLFLSAYGLFFRDPSYRAKSQRLLYFGLWRLGLNVVIFALLAGGNGFLNFLLVPGAFLLLGITVNWCKNQLEDDLAQPGPPAFVPVPPIVIHNAARLGAPAVVTVVAPQVALDLNRAITCPLCGDPTMLEWDDCPACGLMFTSRVPPSLHTLTGYTVLRPLGAGGMSSVYLARIHASEQLCVIKTLVSVDKQDDPMWLSEAANCLSSEAALLGQIDHPHVARLLDHVSAPQGEFLVLDYIPGPTLEQFLSRTTNHGTLILGKTLSHHDAVGYIRDCALTLDYLHHLSYPIVHCDIKPANLILLPHASAPVLVNFGGAQIRHDLNQTAQPDRYGTPGYAAPEQYSGNALPQSDVYGLAATLYHLLTDDDPGLHPLTFPALATLPNELAETLRAALAHDASKRPDARQFADSLTRFC